jgi:hypothetical protein
MTGFVLAAGSHQLAFISVSIRWFLFTVNHSLSTIHGNNQDDEEN